MYGRHTQSFVVRVPTYSDGGTSNIRIHAIPTPPYEFDTARQDTFSNHFPTSETFGTPAESERYPYRYKILRLDNAAAASASPATPIKLTGDDMQHISGDGFAYDCWDTSDGVQANCSTLSQVQCDLEPGRCHYDTTGAGCTPRRCLWNRDCNGHGTALNEFLGLDASYPCNCLVGWTGPTCLTPDTGEGSNPGEGEGSTELVRVRAKGSGIPVGNVPFVPEVLYEGEWHPICGHVFLDNDLGAITLCGSIGLGGAGEADTPFPYVLNDGPTVPVGGCLEDQPLDQCTRGLNHREGPGLNGTN